MSEVDGLNLSDFERKMLGLDLEVTYNYRCLRCQHEDEVPDMVVDGFIASAASDGDIEQAAVSEIAKTIKRALAFLIMKYPLCYS